MIKWYYIVSQISECICPLQERIQSYIANGTVLIPFAENKFIFECVGLAANFRSSLAPWPLPMVARSRHKNLRRFLFKFMNLFSANGITCALQSIQRLGQWGLFRIKCGSFLVAGGLAFGFLKEAHGKLQREAGQAAHGIESDSDDDDDDVGPHFLQMPFQQEQA